MCCGSEFDCIGKQKAQEIALHQHMCQYKYTTHSTEVSEVAHFPLEASFIRCRHTILANGTSRC